MVLFPESRNVRKFQDIKRRVAGSTLRSYRLSRHGVGDTHCAATVDHTDLHSRVRGGCADCREHALLHPVVAE